MVPRRPFTLFNKDESILYQTFFLWEYQAPLLLLSLWSGWKWMTLLVCPDGEAAARAVNGEVLGKPSAFSEDPEAEPLAFSQFAFVECGGQAGQQQIAPVFYDIFITFPSLYY